MQISSGAYKTVQESGPALNPGWSCLRQGWTGSVMPRAGAGSPRPGRKGNKDWSSLLRVQGSSFTTGSQPGRVRNAEAFFTGFFGNFSWRNTGMLFNPLMRDKIWDGLQQSEFWESFASHTDWPAIFRRYAEKEKHSHSSHSLVQFHTLRDRSRLFSHCDT